MLQTWRNNFEWKGGGRSVLYITDLWLEGRKVVFSSDYLIIFATGCSNLWEWCGRGNNESKSVSLALWRLGHLLSLRKQPRPSLFSPWNDVWAATAEIPYWWRELPPSGSGWFFWLALRREKFTSANQKHYPTSGKWHVISMKFLCSFLRRHFAWHYAMSAVFSGFDAYDPVKFL